MLNKSVLRILRLVLNKKANTRKTTERIRISIGYIEARVQLVLFFQFLRLMFHKVPLMLKEYHKTILHKGDPEFQVEHY